MIETIMIFALGFLAATLIALLFIPAINGRAERLARRRAEALFPLSVSELTAEKDHLRAELAVQQRRIERRAEEAFAVKHQTLEEMGRRAVRIEALEGDVAARDSVISGLQGDLSETRSRLRATEDELAGTKAQLSGARETLSAIEAAHRKTLDELGATRVELDRTATTLAGTKSELALALERLEAREVEFADLDGRHTNLLSEMDAKRITISDLETRLATQTARGDEYERATGDRRTELVEERARLAEMDKAFRAEQERALALEARVRELEANPLAAEDPERVGDGTLKGAYEAEAEALGKLEDELALARIRIATLETEAAQKGSLREDNAQLRDMIISVADDIVKASASPPANPAKSRRRSRG